MSLGETIQHYRRGLGISQEELARRLGVSCETVNDWELDRVAPEVGRLKALAEFFSITVDELLSGKVLVGPSKKTGKVGRTPEMNPVWEEEDFSERLKRGFWRYGWLLGVLIALRGGWIVLCGLIYRQGFIKDTIALIGVSAEYIGPMSSYLSDLMTTLLLKGGSILVFGIVLAVVLYRIGRKKYPKGSK